MATAVRRRRRDEDTKRAPGADRYREEPEDDDLDDEDDEELSPRARRRKERDEEPRGRSRRARDEEDDDADEEDEDERPRRGRGRRDEDDDDDEPRGRRRRGRDDDDDEEDDDDERPRGRRRAARDDDDDDDDRPRRGRRSRVDDDDDDDDEDEPRGRRGRSGGRESSAGWDAWNKKRKEMGNFANEVRLPDDESQVLLKFLDDEPFATWGVHWLTMKQGRRPYTCIGPGCPLCDKLGDSPKAMAAFNVLMLGEDADPKLMVWAASPEPTGKIEAKAKARTGPLTKHYYAVSKIKKGGKKNGPSDTLMDVVRERDLREEWGIKPLSDATLEKFEAKMYTEDKYLKRATKQELRQVAREAQDDDD